MSKVCALYHIVFATKNREATLLLPLLDDVYRFLWNIITEHKCSLLRIGGISNHIHLLIDLHPSTPLASLMNELKSKSSLWLKNDPRFTDFCGWGREYFAETISWREKDGVIEYIKNQRVHHGYESEDEEFRKLYEGAGEVYHERDLY